MPAVSPLPFRACSPYLLEGGLFGLPLRNFLTRLPTGTSRRAISPRVGLPIFLTLP